MAEFIVIPANILPFSSRNEQEAIEWALEFADKKQSEQPTGTYVTILYGNLKTNQSGQILSTVYAELVKKAYNNDTLERVFIATNATSSDIADAMKDAGMSETDMVQLIKQHAPAQQNTGMTEAAVEQLIESKKMDTERFAELVKEHAPSIDIDQLKLSIEKHIDNRVMTEEKVAVVADKRVAYGIEKFNDDLPMKLEEQVSSLVQMQLGEVESGDASETNDLTEERVVELIEERRAEELGPDTVSSAPDDDPVTIGQVVALLDQHTMDYHGDGITDLIDG